MYSKIRNSPCHRTDGKFKLVLASGTNRTLSTFFVLSGERTECSRRVLTFGTNRRFVFEYSQFSFLCGKNRRFETIISYVWDKSKIQTCPCVFWDARERRGGGRGRCVSRGRSTYHSLYQTRSSLELNICCLLGIVEALGRGRRGGGRAGCCTYLRGRVSVNVTDRQYPRRQAGGGYPRIHAFWASAQCVRGWWGGGKRYRGRGGDTIFGG